MAAPLFKVEVAFADGPNATAPTYTDISSYVRRDPALTFSRGSQDEVSGLQAGTMSFAVDNSNGRFTPGSSASTSAWGTVLKIRRPVRLSIWNGSSYVVTWTGTVDDWGTGWVGGVQGRTLVTCSDAVAAAGRIDMAAALEAEMLYDNALALFTLREPATATHAVDSNAGATLAITPYGDLSSAVCSFGTGTAPGPDGGGVLTLTPGDVSNGYALVGDVAALSALSDRTYEFWMTADAAPASAREILSNSGIEIELDTTGTLIVRRGVDTTASTKVVSDGIPHHVAVAVYDGGAVITVDIYIDGVLNGTTTDVASPPAATTTVRLGGAPLSLFSGTLSHVAIYPFLLDTARILDHYEAATNWSGETTGERWSRLCRIAGLGSTTYTADTTTGTMGALPTEGATLASLLQRVVDLENGSAYCSTGGVLTLKARSNRYDKASTLTLAPQTIDTDLTFVTNDAYLVNEAAVTGGTGEVGRSSSASSVTDYGVSRRVASVESDTYEQALNLAQWFTYRYAEPGTRARSFSVNATAKAASVTTTNLLALDVDSRITLSPLPAVAPASSVQLFIDGVSGSISDELVFTFNTSPTTYLDGWVLGTDLLDTGTLLLY